MVNLSFGAFNCANPVFKNGYIYILRLPPEKCTFVKVLFAFGHSNVNVNQSVTISVHDILTCENPPRIILWEGIPFFTSWSIMALTLEKTKETLNT